MTSFPWLEQFDRLFYKHKEHLPHYSEHLLSEVRHDLGVWPLKLYRFGNPKASSALFLTAGIHGPEVIGIETLFALLESLLEKSSWDAVTQNYFEKIDFHLIPVANPFGVTFFKRGNGRGVDLMRNAPSLRPNSLLAFSASQSWSSKLPWYSGPFGFSEVETRSTYEWFQTHLLPRAHLISLDFHSGFGWSDQIWFPYAFDRVPFEHMHILMYWWGQFEKAHPYHFYDISPVSLAYRIDGDLWDYFFQQFISLHQADADKVFYLPLTLEMGSWLWVKKQPLQLFRKNGLFYPWAQHRKKRVLRRHYSFFDYVLRSLLHPASWLKLAQKQQHQCWRLGLERWKEQWTR
jgi:hypothetical protein